MPRILFVSGFHPATRARDLAYEFERFGALVRCDVPAPRNPHASSNPRNETNVPTRCYPALPNASRFRQFSSFTREFVDSSSRALSIPPREPRSLNQSSNTSRSYAFVEFRSQRDAEDAYYDMHGRNFEGSRLSIQWAKNPPSSVWRYDRRTSPTQRASRDRERSRSPRRRPEREDREKDRVDDRDRDRDRGERRRRSRTPERRRSVSPDRKRDDRARTPPVDDAKKEIDDRAQTPPYDRD